MQALLAVVWRVPHGLDLGQAIVLPLFVTLVYAFVWSDAAETPFPIAKVLERFLERAWAVIVIDFLLTELGTIALTKSLSSSIVDIVTGLVAFALSVLLVFADASATVDDDVTVWNVVPRAFVRSITAAWTSTTFSRALAIYSLVLLLSALQLAIYFAMERGHVPQAAFWSSTPLLTIAVAPISALTVVVYRDARSAQSAT